MVDEGTSTAVADETKPEEKIKLETAFRDAGPCRKHVTVTIPKAEVDRFFNKEFSELVKDANVPGFRPGKTPRKLIERYYRKGVSKSVKAALLMQSLEQLSEDESFEPLRQPEIDFEHIELPESADFTYEFEVDVRPQFDLGEFKGLKVKRPKTEVTDGDIDDFVKRIRRQVSQPSPKTEGGAELGDVVTVALKVMDGEKLVGSLADIEVEVREQLALRDSTIATFGSAIQGAKAGDVRTAPLKFPGNHAQPALRNKEFQAEISIKSLNTVVPAADETLLASLGFESMDETKQFARDVLSRRREKNARDSMREQLMDVLAPKVGSIPAETVQRLAERTLQRQVVDMVQSGYSKADIQARSNMLRQNSAASAERIMREQFVLQKVADLEKLEVTEDEIEQQIAKIAADSGESYRKVRARIMKENLFESVAIQALEEKALDVLLNSAQIEETNVADEEEEIKTSGVDEDVVAEAPAAAEQK